MEYYVYAFYNDYIPIYIGYGKNMRWKDHFSMRTNLRLNRFLAKNLGNKPIFVAENISIEEAKSLEKHLIATFGRIDIKTGSLYNLTNGGDGTSGLKMTEDQKITISAGAKRRWANKEQRDRHSLLMSAATNSSDFKQRSTDRRPDGWLSFKEKKKLNTQERKNTKLTAIKTAFDEHDELTMFNLTGIKTVSGLQRFLKRNGFIEK